MKADEEMAVAVRVPGRPGFCAVAMELPRDADAEYRREHAKFIAAQIRRGNTIERVTRDEAVAGMSEYIADKKARAAGPSTDALPLFEASP